MSYSIEEQRELDSKRRQLRENYANLLIAYQNRNFTNERAQKYVLYGLCRRLKLMDRCISKVFDILPPNSNGIPDSDVIHDVTVHLHAFVFNAYGSIDNLAQIWILEKDLKRDNGQPIPLNRRTFHGQNSEIQASLPDAIKLYLTQIQDWMNDLKSFRHALAHRIPLYVPPGHLDENQGKEYRRLQEEINEAIGQEDFEAADSLEQKQAALLSFHPIATHSFNEDPKIMFFHVQMLKDFHIIQEIASKLLPHFHS